MDADTIRAWAGLWGVRLPPPPPGWDMWGTFVVAEERVFLVVVYVGGTEVQCAIEVYTLK